MNNEISNDITMRTMVKRLEAAYNKEAVQNPASPCADIEKSAQSSMECLNMLGHAKVNMDNTSKRVVKDFKLNIKN